MDGLTVIFFRQFQSPLIYILLAASAIVFAMGETIDGSIILAVLLFNAIVGTIQEGKAQNTLLALKKFVETKATVLRDGKELIIHDSEVVPGDIIILQEGEKAPADARVIAVANLKIDQAALTGESDPAHKIADALPARQSLGVGGEGADLATAEQKNMIFKGTHILAGNGRAVVVATGLETVIGKISKEILAIDTEIPLKTSIRYLSRLIIITVASISALLFLLGIVSGKSAQRSQKRPRTLCFLMIISEALCQLWKRDEAFTKQSRKLFSIFFQQAREKQLLLEKKVNLVSL